MKLPRGLAGAELIKLLCKHYGYAGAAQDVDREDILRHL